MLWVYTRPANQHVLYKLTQTSAQRRPTDIRTRLHQRTLRTFRKSRLSRRTRFINSHPYPAMGEWGFPNPIFGESTICCQSLPHSDPSRWQQQNGACGQKWCNHTVAPLTLELVRPHPFTRCGKRERMSHDWQSISHHLRSLGQFHMRF